MIQQTIDGVRWQLQPDFAPLLGQVLKSPGQVVKESPVKAVTRHQSGGKIFYLKRYLHHAVTLRPLKFIFKRSQAAQEWSLARQLEERGIPIVRHVGVGERWSWRGLQESILITEGFDGAQLNETSGVPVELVQGFVQLMHERGVLQRDLHPANLLVRREPLELRLVDLHGTVVKTHLPQAERDENLAVLRGYLPIQVSPEVERLSIRIRREQLQERSARCLRHNREFAPLPLGGLKWQARHPLDDRAGRIMDDPDGFLQRSAKLLKEGRSATVGAGGGFVLKRYNLRRASRLLKDLFRASPAAASFRKAYHLELTGIPTARAIAMAERRRFRFLLRSYFLMEEIPGALSLQERLKGGRLSTEEIDKVARLVGDLHRQGFSHRDLKASNLVFDQGGALFLIDLDGLTYLGEIPESRAAWDLNRLWRGVEQSAEANRRTLRTFLKTYCQARNLKRIPRTSY